MAFRRSVSHRSTPADDTEDDKSGAAANSRSLEPPKRDLSRLYLSIPAIGARAVALSLAATFESAGSGRGSHDDDNIDNIDQRDGKKQTQSDGGNPTLSPGATA